MKLIEIPDTVMILGPDDAGVMELSADLGDAHIARELERLGRSAIVPERTDSKGLVRELTKAPKRKQEDRAPTMVSGVASHLASILRGGGS